MIKIINKNLINYGLRNVSFHSSTKNETETKQSDPRTSIKYLDNLAMINAPAVKKIDKSNEVYQYKNNLKTMIKNNESVMMAIVPRTFTAEDINGDDKISFKDGEKNGTFFKCNHKAG